MAGAFPLTDSAVPISIGTALLIGATDTGMWPVRHRTVKDKMGAVSAEARGLVRLQLARLNEPRHDSVLVRLRTITERRTQGFRAGKRLKEIERAELDTELIQAIPEAYHVNGAIIYAHHGAGTMEDEEKNFEEDALIVRCLRLGITRRKVEFTDYVLGVNFCFHSLCRIVERATLTDSLVEYILKNSLQLAAYLLVMWRVCGDNLNFAIPFGDGLVLGTIVTIQFNAASTTFVSDRSDVGFLPVENTTPWNDPDKERHAGRVSTFLSFDQLTPPQEELFQCWQQIRSEHSRSWEALSTRIVQSDSWSPFEYAECSLQLNEAVQRLLRSDAWRRVVRAT